MTEDEKIGKAFLLGFMITEEGFNAECSIPEFCPKTLKYEGRAGDFKEFFKWVDNDKEIQELKRQAIEYVNKLTD